jgi:hypothetical protein
MATIRYAVLQVAEEWRVVCERRQIGHFPSLGSAVDAGARLAREAVTSGHAVEFMVQDATGFLVAETFRPRSAPPDAILHTRAQP